MKGKGLKEHEVWYQDLEDSNLWHGGHGVIVNTAALDEREFYYDILRVNTPHDFCDVPQAFVALERLSSVT